MILVVVTTPEPPVDALRLVAGLVAGGHEVRLLEAGPGVGTLSGADDLPEEAETYLRAIADFDVKPEPVEDTALREALLACTSLMRIGDPARTGEPPVLELTEETIRRKQNLTPLLAGAGQIVRGGLDVGAT